MALRHLLHLNRSTCNYICCQVFYLISFHFIVKWNKLKFILIYCLFLVYFIKLLNFNPARWYGTWDPWKKKAGIFFTCCIWCLLNCSTFILITIVPCWQVLCLVWCTTLCTLHYISVYQQPEIYQTICLFSVGEFPRKLKSSQCVVSVMYHTIIISICLFIKYVC